MTLDEAIKHAEEVAEEKENEGKLLCQSEGASIGCLTCAEEHRQLAEWLRDYKRLKEQELKVWHWILAEEQNKEDVENDNYRFVCSECQCSDIHAKGTKVPYCWKCGAKMESEV